MASTRESDKLFEAGALAVILTFMTDHGDKLHKDIMQSCMSIVTRLCGRLEPGNASLDTCITALSKLLEHDDLMVIVYVFNMSPIIKMLCKGLSIVRKHIH